MTDPKVAWGSAFLEAFKAPTASPAPQVSTLPEAEAEARDLAEERAAILEYMAGLPRREAEARAYAMYGLRPPKR